MLAYARLEQWEDAAVEARRLSALLAEYAPDRSDAEKATHATLHYLAAVVFERAGEYSDAEVAYRLARQAGAEQSDAAPAGRGEGDVLLIVERGFVAHRATESINIYVGGDSARHRRSRRDHEYDRDGEDNGEGGYWLSVAFPSLRRSARVSGEPALLVDGASAASSRVASVLDDAAAADESRERTAWMARAVARATAKYVVVKAVKDKKGDVAGQVANLGAALLERADVRSWHLLPQQVTLLRMHVPAGERHLLVETGGGAGAGRVDVGPVTVRPGQVTIATVRLWTDGPYPLLAAR